MTPRKIVGICLGTGGTFVGGGVLIAMGLSYQNKTKSEQKIHISDWKEEDKKFDSITCATKHKTITVENSDNRINYYLCQSVTPSTSEVSQRTQTSLQIYDFRHDVTFKIIEGTNHLTSKWLYNNPKNSPKEAFYQLRPKTNTTKSTIFLIPDTTTPYTDEMIKKTVFQIQKFYLWQKQREEVVKQIKKYTTTQTTNSKEYYETDKLRFFWPINTITNALPTNLTVCEKAYCTQSTEPVYKHWFYDKQNVRTFYWKDDLPWSVTVDESFKNKTDEEKKQLFANISVFLKQNNPILITQPLPAHNKHQITCSSTEQKTVTNPDDYLYYVCKNPQWETGVFMSRRKASTFEDCTIDGVGYKLYDRAMHKDNQQVKYLIKDSDWANFRLPPSQDDSQIDRCSINPTN